MNVRHSTLLLTLFVLAACSSKQEPPKTSETTIESTTLEITNGWVRPTQAGMMTAAYFTIENHSAKADSLLSVIFEKAADTQIHESFAAEGGMMGMRPVGLIPVASKSRVELKPGGIHVMIMRPYENVSEGDSLELILTFSELGDRVVKLPVKSSQ